MPPALERETPLPRREPGRAANSNRQTTGNLMIANSRRSGKSTRRKRTRIAASTTNVGLVQQMALSAIWPSPENDRLYRPIDRSEPDIIALAESICEHGVLEPIITT